MASYLRPRRGSLANAKAQLTASAPLKSGEVFFECENIGNAQGKIKLGNGSSTYSSLPYFLSMEDSSIGFTNSTGSNASADSTLLSSTNMGPSTAHKTVIGNIKQLLWNHSKKIDQLNNDKEPKIQVYTNTVTSNQYAQFNINIPGVDLSNNFISIRSTSDALGIFPTFNTGGTWIGCRLLNIGGATVVPASSTSVKYYLWYRA